ncbi:MAG: ATP-binding protein [Candidatus Nitrosoabyssus spongiisocia]|nr:MAG: ATP-binding protein [Nitrosopumilaceae archaeon AB1(1)]
MLINSLLIKNYRSITKAELPLHNYSILIGPNNQGKSNILRGLVVALNIIKYESLRSHRFPHTIKFPLRLKYRQSLGRRTKILDCREQDYIYNYERDFPLKLQNNDKKREGQTKFELTLSLSDEEKVKYQRKTKNKLKGDLRIKISIGHFHLPLSVVIEDSASPKKIKNKEETFTFIIENIELTYIEAIRDSDKTIQIVEKMISDELSLLEREKKYNDLMKEIELMQKPVLDDISKSLTKSVSEFLPDVKEIHLNSGEELKRIASSSTTLNIDDGTDTELKLKGDGIKSLLAISIIQHVTQKNAREKKIVLAIEEPESHLHPEAIHKLRIVLEDISSKNQVIISTHSPLLVNRTNLARNLIVDKSQVTAAENISQIRKVLGVQIADNLTSASLVILTEGAADSKKLERWATELSSDIKDAIFNGIIIFSNLGGVNNLASESSKWKLLLCDVYSFLDYDKEGREAFEVAKEKKSIFIKDVSFATLSGYSDSELEDLISPSSYKNEISKMGVDISRSTFKNNREKWSVRMRNTFKDQGKPWNNEVKNSVKKIITDVSIELGIKCIHKKNQEPILKFVEAIEKYLGKRSETKKN